MLQLNTPYTTRDGRTATFKEIDRRGDLYWVGSADGAQHRWMQDGRWRSNCVSGLDIVAGDVLREGK